MAETSIEWTSGPNAEPGYTFNPVEGCEKVSPGCKNCYAERKNKWLHGGENWGPGSPRLQRSDAYWRKPAQWNADAAAAGQRRKVFCASVADVFEDHPGWVEPRARLFLQILTTPHLDWLLLTKRPENIERLFPKAGSSVVWANVWLGTTAENQAEADRRIPILQAAADQRAVVTFISFEPQLELIDFTKSIVTGRAIDWAICGGESGPGARTFDIAWARALRDQCASLDVAFFMKQLGQRTRMRPSEVGGDLELEPMVFPMRKKEAGDPATWPADLRVRQFPEVPHV